MAPSMRVLLLCFSLTVFTSAFPSSPTSATTTSSESFLVTFDTLAQNAGPSPSPISDSVPFHWYGWNIAEHSSATTANAAITPPSPPNTAVSGTISQMNSQGPPTISISAEAQSQNITSFDAGSIYFACISQGDTATTAIPCVVKFLGTYYGGGSSGAATATQQSSFAPGTMSPSQYQLVTFDPTLFQGLQTLALSIVLDSTTSASTTTKLLIDTFKGRIQRGS